MSWRWADAVGTRHGSREKADPHGANGSDACSAQQHNYLLYLAFCGQKTHKKALLKVRNVGYKVLFFGIKHTLM